MSSWEIRLFRVILPFPSRVAFPMVSVFFTFTAPATSTIEAVHAALVMVSFPPTFTTVLLKDTASTVRSFATVNSFSLLPAPSTKSLDPAAPETVVNSALLFNSSKALPPKFAAFTSFTYVLLLFSYFSAARSIFSNVTLVGSFISPTKRNSILPPSFVPRKITFSALAGSVSASCVSTSSDISTIYVIELLERVAK